MGRPLATNETPLAFVAGRTQTYTVALDGIPAYFTISPNGNGYLQGSRNGLTLYGSSTQQVIVVSLDRDGNPIIGPGAPAIHLSASSPALLVVPLGASNPNVFTLNAQTSGKPAVVSAGTVYLTASAAQPPASGAGSATITVPVLIAHAVIAISTGSKVLEFYDGNTTPSVTLSTSANSIAMDQAGNVFGLNSAGSPIAEYPLGSNSATLSFKPYNGAEQLIAVGPSDTIFAANTSLGIGLSAFVDVYAPGATSASSETFVDAGFVNGLAVDANGTWYLSTTHYDEGGPQAPPPYGLITTPNSSINTGTTNFPGALAVDGSGTIYAAFGGTIGARGSSSINKTLTGLKSPASIAVDVAGNVYVAGPGRGVWSSTRRVRPSRQRSCRSAERRP